MALIPRSDGIRRDIPLGPGIYVGAAAAGSSSDYEHVVGALVSLTSLAASGTAGDMPLNAMTVRAIIWTPEAALTGAATHNFTWQLLQKRAGALLVNTSTSTAVASAGVATITPSSMTNIVVGASLVVDSGASQETVVVTATTATTFTATFANTHSSTWNIVSAPLASVTYASGTNESALVPHQLKALTPNKILPGDILTFARVSSDSTGLASPALKVDIDWVPLQGSRPAS
jgi:hypothetical protein